MTVCCKHGVKYAVYRESKRLFNITIYCKGAPLEDRKERKNIWRYIPRLKSPSFQNTWPLFTPQTLFSDCLVHLCLYTHLAGRWRQLGSPTLPGLPGCRCWASSLTRSGCREGAELTSSPARWPAHSACRTVALCSRPPARSRLSSSPQTCWTCYKAKSPKCPFKEAAFISWSLWVVQTVLLCKLRTFNISHSEPVCVRNTLVQKIDMAYIIFQNVQEEIEFTWALITTIRQKKRLSNVFRLNVL